MTSPGMPSPSQPRTKPQVETGRFFAGGLIAAVIAAIAGVVTWGLANVVLDTDLVEQPPNGDYSTLTAVEVLVVSLVLGLIATVVLYLFVMAVPRPIAMFRALGGVFIAASMLPILVMDTPGFDLGGAATQNQIALVVLHLVVGCSIIGLLDGVARSTVRYVRQEVPPAGQQPQQGYQQPQQQPNPGYQQPQQQPNPGYQPPQPPQQPGSGGWQ